MQNADWLKIKEVFNQTLDLPESERDNFLANFDESLRLEVSELLKSHQSAENFIDEPAAIEFGLSQDRLIGTKIDDYQIIKEIGVGGMGKVYLTQREGFEQKFALKLIKRGMDTDTVLKRFVLERQILSRLEHPNIARLLNAGSTESGLPYFVMEYVEGLPVTKFCEAHQLSTDEKLELFQKICSAVNYAHQNLIVHRDIKPSNILVTADGTPKLFDFGIAKLLNSQQLDQTATQARILTPEYASPEQLNNLPITTATDVYSLGIVLHELLNGNRPLSVVSGQFEMARNTDKNKLETQSANNPKSKIQNPKSADLDNIIQKSLREEPTRRYQTVQEFSEDIRRFLVGLPVTATADSTFYRFSKFVQRHQQGVIAGALVSLLILTISGVAIWQSIVANRERAKAEKRFNQVRKLANSVLFEYHDGIESLPGSTQIREKMVKDALEYLDNLSAESGDDESLQSELALAFIKVGDIQGNPYFSNLGDMNGAQSSYQKALPILENLVANHPHQIKENRALATTYGSIADIFWAKGENERALENYQKALTIDQTLANENPADNTNQFALGIRFYYIGQTLRKMNDSAGALENFRKSFEISEKLCVSAPVNKSYCNALATSCLKIGDVFFDSRNYDEALRNHQKAVEILEPFAKNETDTDGQRTLALFLNRVASDKKGLGKLNEAINLNLKAIGIIQKLVEADSKNEQFLLDLATYYQSLGELFLAVGKTTESVENLKKAIKIFTNSLEKNPDDAETKEYFASAKKTLAEALRQ